MLDREKLEQQLCELPLYQYAFLNTEDLVFTERVRKICESECPMYNTNWACPPAVGTVDECHTRCMVYPQALMISSVTEVKDIANIDETLATRAPHEALTRQVTQLVRAQCSDTLTLSTESCVHCARCTWPDAPCRFPDKARSAMEALGIDVVALAADRGITYDHGAGTVTYFSIVFYH